MGRKGAAVVKPPIVTLDVDGLLADVNANEASPVDVNETAVERNRRRSREFMRRKRAANRKPLFDFIAEGAR
jgi:hypothetical protein